MLRKISLRQRGTMFVILSYDVNKKRAAKVLKTCRRYLCHVHRSVFQGRLTEAQLGHLKDDLLKIVDPDADSVRIYEFCSTRFAFSEDLGLAPSASNIM